MKLFVAVLLTSCFASLAMAQPAAKPEAAPMPKVYLSDRHETMINVGVGDAFPELMLPSPDKQSETATIATRYGKVATVVALFGRNSAMSKTLLRDLQIDITEDSPPGDPVVLPVAIATGLASGEAQKVAKSAKYDGPLLLDSDGKGFEQLGNERTPRVYVLDAEGKIAWFDIEYSSATRREMRQAVEALIFRSK